MRRKYRDKSARRALGFHLVLALAILLFTWYAPDVHALVLNETASIRSRAVTHGRV